MNKKIVNWFKKTRNRVILFVITLAIILFSTIPLPYEILLPGGVSDIEEIVVIENEYESEGEFQSSYVTVITKPTALVYFYTKTFKDAEVVPLSDNAKELSVKEINQYSRISKQNSIYTSLISAYNEAGRDIQYEKNGLIIAYRFVEYPVFNQIQLGDVLTEFNGHPITNQSELQYYQRQLTSCDNEVVMKIIRDGKEQSISSKLKDPGDGVCRIGVMPFVNYMNVEGDPKFEILDDGGYGGSAGLMQALMIYNKLTEEDITRGHKIAGTGGIDEGGNVTLISGIRQKVMGAIKDDVELFFAPDLTDPEGVNLYLEAIRTKREMKSDITIVPVKTLEDALEYLDKTYGNEQ